MVALRAPIEDGFVLSFNLSQPTEIRNFFDTYGFVVIQNVLDQEAVENTLAEFFSGVPGGMDASDEQLENFYKLQPFGKMGIIGGCSNINSVTQLQNRQNPRVYEAFCIIFGCNNLIVEHDRLGVMRPTMRESGEKTRWRTLERWLHLDCNPVTGKASIGGYDVDREKEIDFEKQLIIQALITLTDARIEDGGFHCVPGGHKLSVEWAKQQRGKDSHLQVEREDPIRGDIQQIPMKKGCLLVWNTLLFHGNHPNFSSNWRAVQYLRMLPSQGTPYSPLVPELNAYPAEFQMTALGRKLFGIDKYDEDRKAESKRQQSNMIEEDFSQGIANTEELESDVVKNQDSGAIAKIEERKGPETMFSPKYINRRIAKKKNRSQRANAVEVATDQSRRSPSSWVIYVLGALGVLIVAMCWLAR